MGNRARADPARRKLDLRRNHQVGGSADLWRDTISDRLTKPIAFERIVQMSPAFDKRSSDPKKNYGIHGVDLRMILKGPLGATQFVLYTGWHLPHVTEELWSKNSLDTLRVVMRPLPADVGYHWHKPQYDGQEPMKCEYVEGGQCYYDGSGLQAEKVYEILLNEGSDGVWKELEQRYHELAGDTP
jgi:hypothetical protein